jgi:hypothetical protein
MQQQRVTAATTSKQATIDAHEEDGEQGELPEDAPQPLARQTHVLHVAHVATVNATEQASSE